MITKYKGKAYWGLCLWVTFNLLAVGIWFSHPKHPDSPDPYKNLRMILLFCNIIVIYVVFFWAGFYLAEAKGYASVINLFGLLGPIVQLIIFVALLLMPDKNRKHTLMRRDKDASRWTRP